MTTTTVTVHHDSEPEVAQTLGVAVRALSDLGHLVVLTQVHEPKE